MINYAQKIKEYRERKFLTQVEFAELLGVGKLQDGKQVNSSQLLKLRKNCMSFS